jgi:hypothetical protein
MQGKRGGAQQISRAYDALLLSVIDLLETGRQIAARSVNALLTMTYWQVGQRLVEHEQGGAERADYGSGLLKRLSRDLQRASVVVSLRETWSKCANSICNG